MKMLRIVIISLLLLFLTAGASAQVGITDLRVAKNEFLKFFIFSEDFITLDSTRSLAGGAKETWTVARHAEDVTLTFLSDQTGGVLQAQTAAKDTSGFRAYWTSVLFQPDSQNADQTNPIIFRASIMFDSLRQFRGAAGLMAGTDTLYSDATRVVDFMGFKFDDLTDSVLCIVVRNGIGDTVAFDGLAQPDTWINMEFTYNGFNRINWVVNDSIGQYLDVTAGSSDDFFPNDVFLRPMFELFNGSTDKAQKLRIRDMWIGTYRK